MLRQKNAKLKRKVEGGEQVKLREVLENIASMQKTPSHPHTSPNTEKESGYDTTPKTRGVTNASFVVGGSHKHPFMDGIMETPLPTN